LTKLKVNKLHQAFTVAGTRYFQPFFDKLRQVYPRGIQTVYMKTRYVFNLRSVCYPPSRSQQIHGRLAGTTHNTVTFGALVARSFGQSFAVVVLIPFNL